MGYSQQGCKETWLKQLSTQTDDNTLADVMMGRAQDTVGAQKGWLSNPAGGGGQRTVSQVLKEWVSAGEDTRWTVREREPEAQTAVWAKAQKWKTAAMCILRRWEGGMWSRDGRAGVRPWRSLPVQGGDGTWSHGPFPTALSVSPRSLSGLGAESVEFPAQWGSQRSTQWGHRRPTNLWGWGGFESEEASEVLQAEVN